MFDTITNTDGNKSTKTSEVNLIDLAGACEGCV
jgi:Fe-S cluster biogenesis protein NfuA